MTNLSKFLSAAWGILCIGVVVVLLLVYANFPLQSRWELPEQLGRLSFTKERFFYWMAFSFIIANVLYYLSIKVLDEFKKIAPKKIALPRYHGIRLGLKIQITGLNLFLIFFMFFLKWTSANDGITSFWSAWLFFFGPLIMILGLFYALFWLVKPQKIS